MYTNRGNFCIFNEIGEYDGDVRFKSRSGHMAVSLCARYASGHNYCNSLVMMDLAMGQIHLPQNVFLVMS